MYSLETGSLHELELSWQPASPTDLPVFTLCSTRFIGVFNLNMGAGVWGAQVFMLMKQALISMGPSLRASWWEFIWILTQTKLLTNTITTMKEIVALNTKTPHAVGSSPSILQASFDLIIFMPPWETQSPKCTEETRENSRAEIDHKHGSELVSGGASVLIQAFHSRMLCLLGSHFIPLGIEFCSCGCNDLFRSDIRSPSSLCDFTL